jgi:hypothetical protein
LLLSAVASAQTPTPTLQERMGHPANARLLILHADDVGMSRSVNKATLEALEKGWVTSASVLVACPWFPEVARWSKEHPDADLGIHLALNSEWTGFRWGPVSRTSLVPTLTDAQGYLPLTSEEVMEKAAPADVEHELRAQIEKARAFGMTITHLDSHMGTLFRTPALFDVYVRMGQAYRYPQLISQGSRTGTSSLGLVPGGSSPESPTVDQVLEIRPGVPKEKWVDTYKDMLRPLPPGVYQLILHTAYDDEEMRAATWDHPDWGAAWRQNDLDMVKSPDFQKFLRDEGFILVRWKDIGKALAGPAAPPAAPAMSNTNKK